MDQGNNNFLVVSLSMSGTEWDEGEGEEKVAGKLGMY